MVQGNKKKSILVINQYYDPDRASTGQLLTELCERLADHFEVTAIVGKPSYSITGHATKASSKSRVKLIRVFNTSFGRKNMLGRVTNHISFMFFATVKALSLRKRDATVVMSDPPAVNFIGYLVKILKGGKLVQICQDVYPEVALALKRADNPLIIWLFSLMNKIAQSACDGLIAISQGMKGILIRKGLSKDKISVIENWVDDQLLAPHKKDNPFSQAHGIVDKFVVAHSGNIGFSQNLDLLIGAAHILKDKREIVFLIIGDGARKDELIKLAKGKCLPNVKFLPYQEKQDLKYSLSSADLHFVSLKKGLSGLIVPSKIYGIMAAGRPVIACLDKDDDIAKLIEEVNFGVNVEKPDPNSIAKQILYFYNNKNLLKELGVRGRHAVTQRNSSKIILKRYIEYLSSITEV